MVSIRRHENGLAATGSALLLLALSVGSATAALEEEFLDTVVYREGSVAYKASSSERGHWGEDLDEVSLTLNGNKTAWGSVPFDYPNLSNNWQQVSDTPGWSWNITLQGNVDGLVQLKNRSTALMYQTQGIVSLQTPTSQNGSALPVDKEWKMCLLHWDLGNGKYNDKLRTDDGSCSSVLSESCRDALSRRIEYTFAVNGTCACPPAATDVPECAAEVAAGATGPWDSSCAAEAVDAHAAAGWSAGNKPLFAFAAAGFYDAGDLAVYNDLGSVAWPVLSVLAGVGDGVRYTRSQLACVRATHAIDGWKVPALSAAQNTTEADGPVKTNAASAADVGSFGAFLLGVGTLLIAFVI